MQALAYGPAVCGLWSFASSETHPLDTVPAVVCNINHTFNTTTPRHQIQIRCSCDGPSVETLACACLVSSFLAVLCVETLTPKNARHPPFMSQFKLLTKEDVCVMCFVVATVRSYTAIPLSPRSSRVVHQDLLWTGLWFTLDIQQSRVVLQFAFHHTPSPMRSASGRRAHSHRGLNTFDFDDK